MSIRPNALDRENGATQSSVRNHQASRGLRCVPRRSGSAANTLQVHLGLRSVAAPNCPAPLPVAAGLWLLGLNVPHRSRWCRQGARSYAPHALAREHWPFEARFWNWSQQEREILPGLAHSRAELHMAEWWLLPPVNAYQSCNMYEQHFIGRDDGP